MTTTWYWKGTTGSLTTVSNWNSLPDGSGSAPASIAAGGGASDIKSTDKLVFFEGSQDVTSGFTLNSCAQMTVEVTDGYSGSLGDETNGLSFSLNRLIYAGRGPRAHFSGAAAGTTPYYRIMQTHPNSKALYLSGALSATGTVIDVLGGNVHFASASQVVALARLLGGVVTDVEGVEWRSVYVDGAEWNTVNGVYNSGLSLPGSSPVSFSDYATLELYSGLALLGTKVKRDFNLKMFGGELGYNGRAAIVNALWVAGVFNTKNNPNSFTLGSDTQGTPRTGGTFEKWASAKLLLLHKGGTATFAQALNRRGGDLLGQDLVTLADNTDGLTLA